MRFYSDITKKFYNTVEECEKAETSAIDKAKKKKIEEEKKLSERKARAQEIEDKIQSVAAARKELNELIEKFVKDYGSYHATYAGKGAISDAFFDSLFNFFW